MRRAFLFSGPVSWILNRSKYYMLNRSESHALGQRGSLGLIPESLSLRDRSGFERQESVAMSAIMDCRPSDLAMIVRKILLEIDQRSGMALKPLAKGHPVWLQPAIMRA